MRSRRAVLAATLFLLALPTALLCQVVFGAGAEITIHAVLAAASTLLSLAVFDFAAPRWVTWIASLAAGALAGIFLLQGIALGRSDERLTRVAFDVLGQLPEGLLGDAVLVWFLVVLWLDSRGLTRAAGLAAVIPALCLQVTGQLMRQQNASTVALPAIFQVLLLLPFVWLFAVGVMKPVQPGSHTPEKIENAADAH
jgi:hypothetical protein